MKPISPLSFLALVSLLSFSIVDAANADVCKQTIGPYWSQYEAEATAQEAQMQGYQTFGVWGSDGIISDASNRKYWFNVFYQC
jgi:hypothetical protein